MTDLERALLAAATVLRQLPRGLTESLGARQRLAELRAQHPQVKIDWVLVPRPGGHSVCDILLTDASGHSLALTSQPETGVPFGIEHAEPLAASRVLTLDEDSTTIQDALLWLKAEGESAPVLADKLVHEALLARAVARAEVEVDERALQAEADAFRRAQGLHSAAATQSWLAQQGLSSAGFEAVIRARAQRRAFLTELCASRVEPYFEAHRASFDRVSLVRVDAACEADLSPLLMGAGADLSERVVSVLRGEGGPVSARALRLFAHELPRDLCETELGVVQGAFAEGEGFWVAQLLRRDPAVLDASTQKAVQSRVIEAWLTEEQGKVRVRWHWP